MREYTTTIYRFDELTPDAQWRAWENNNFNLAGDHSDEFLATMAAFEDVFDIRVYRWSVDDWSYDYNFVAAGRAVECPEGDALRVARYIWNNYASGISKGKYYGKLIWNGNKSRHVKRYSRATFEMDNCPLTGVCYDYDILQPVIDCLHYKRFFETFDDLITACLDNFFAAWRNEIDYCNSFEYFAEIAEINDWEFTENGDFWRGAVAV